MSVTEPLTKRRKVDAENRVFQVRWEEEYCFTFIDNKPVCLVCEQVLTVNKEYNLKRHYESKHEKTFGTMSMTMRVHEVARLKEKLKEKSGGPSASNRTKSDDALRAGLLVADLIVRRGKPFTDGPLIKECLLKAASVVCPEASPSFEMISLSANTIARRTEVISADLESQLREKCKNFTHFSLAMDESTDLSDTAQCAIFVRGTDNTLHVTEELLSLVPLHDTTTGNDLCVALLAAVEKFKLSWENFTALATDGAPAMKGDKKSGLVKRLRLHLKSLGLPDDFPHIHCIIHQEALCAQSLDAEHVMSVVVKAVNKIRAQGLNHRQFRGFLEEIGSEYTDIPFYCKARWLSRAKVLKSFFDLRNEIYEFLGNKKICVPEIKDAAWVQDLAFLVDITGHLNNLNIKLQGKDKLVCDMLSAVQGFEMRLEVFEEEVLKGELYHFSALASLNAPLSIESRQKYGGALQKLQSEFSDKNFRDLRRMEKDINIFSDPFCIDLHSTPQSLKLELIDLRVDRNLKSRFESLPLAEFASFISVNRFPRLHNHFSKMMAIFGSTYVCEQLFSLMKYVKSRYRTRLTDERLLAQLRVMARNGLEPNIDSLVAEGRAQVSPSVFV